MAKRLFDDLDQGLGEEILLLDDLPPPDQREACCGMCLALGRALKLLGHEATYARLMGLTGAAFLVPLGRGLVTSWRDAKTERHLLQALHELGLPARREEPAEAEALTLCRAQLQVKRPLLAEGAEADWAVIVGLKGEELLAQLAGSARQFERYPLPVAALVIFESGGEARPSLTASLSRALPLLAESQARWLAWQERLGLPEPYGPELGRRERFLAEQYLSASVLDARDAAEQFLLEMAQQEDYEPAEALDRAAEAAGEVVGVLEQLLAPPEVIEVAHLPEDPAWLERRRELLEEARERDERLRRTIATALDIAGEDA